MRGLPADPITEIAGARAIRWEWDRLCDRLIGRRQLWLDACRYAVQEEDEIWLEGYLRPGEQKHLHWPLGLLEERLGPQAVSTALSITWFARAVLLVGQSHGAAEAAEALTNGLVSWQEALGREHSRSDLRDLLSAIAGALDPNRVSVEAMIAGLEEHVPSQDLGAIRDLALHLSGKEVVCERTEEVRVPFDRHTEGILVDLTLELTGEGPCGLYPDPRIMAFFRAGPDAAEGKAFEEALAAAWRYALSRFPEGVEVRWKLGAAGAPLLEAQGDSIGLACAVGLCHLLDPNAPPLDSSWVLTGSVTAEGNTASISGYKTKLEAVKKEGHNVVVPAADLRRAQKARAAVDPSRRIGKLEGALSVKEASVIVSAPYEALTRYLEDLLERTEKRLPPLAS